mgnify:CR=1 FL=1
MSRRGTRSRTRRNLSFTRSQLKSLRRKVEGEVIIQEYEELVVIGLFILRTSKYYW